MYQRISSTTKQLQPRYPNNQSKFERFMCAVCAAFKNNVFGHYPFVETVVNSVIYNFVCHLMIDDK